MRTSYKLSENGQKVTRFLTKYPGVRRVSARRLLAKSCVIMNFGLDPLGFPPGIYGFLGSSDQSVPASSNQFSQIPPAVPAHFLHQVIRESYDGSLGQRPEMAVRGSWAQHEDALLLQAVQQFGPTQWVNIAKFVPCRTAKQCRERWQNRLSPALKREPFEPWEDQIIVQKQKQVGNRWSIIAQALPGRSAGAVKNRWYAALKESPDAGGFVQALVTGDRVDFE
jgi:hypothetical protein